MAQYALRNRELSYFVRPRDAKHVSLVCENRLELAQLLYCLKVLLTIISFSFFDQVLILQIYYLIAVM